MLLLLLRRMSIELRRWWTSTMLLLLLLRSQLLLHGNGSLLLQSQFSSGQPTADAVVRLVPPAGQPLELGRTDSQGRLSFALPAQASGAWELQVDGGPGHRDYLEMPVRAGQADLERISLEERAPIGAGWIAALSGCGAAAMLLGLQRIRHPR